MQTTKYDLLNFQIGGHEYTLAIEDTSLLDSALYRLKLSQPDDDQSIETLRHHLVRHRFFMQDETDDSNNVVVLNGPSMIAVIKLRSIEPKIYLLTNNHGKARAREEWFGNVYAFKPQDIAHLVPGLHQTKAMRATSSSSDTYHRAVLQLVTEWHSNSGVLIDFGRASFVGIDGWSPSNRADDRAQNTLYVQPPSSYGSFHHGQAVGGSFPDGGRGQHLQQPGTFMQPGYGGRCGYNQSYYSYYPSQQRVLQNESGLSTFAVDGRDAVLAALGNTFMCNFQSQSGWTASEKTGSWAQVAVQNFLHTVSSLPNNTERQITMRAAAQMLAALLRVNLESPTELDEDIRTFLGEAFDLLVGVK